MLGMGSAGRAVDVGARAGAGIDELAPLQLGEGRLVDRKPIGLNDRPLVPGEAEPVEVVEELLTCLELDPRRIDVLDPQDELRVLPTSGEPGEEIGAGVAEMLLAGRRRGEAGDDARLARRIRRVGADRRSLSRRK